MDPDDDEDDWAEIACEEKLAKRVRQGIVSQEEFEVEFEEICFLENTIGFYLYSEYVVSLVADLKVISMEASAECGRVESTRKTHAVEMRPSVDRGRVENLGKDDNEG